MDNKYYAILVVSHDETNKKKTFFIEVTDTGFIFGGDMPVEDAAKQFKQSLIDRQEIKLT